MLTLLISRVPRRSLPAHSRYMISVESLNKIKLFHGLDPNLLRDLGQHVRVESFRKRDSVVEGGSAGEALLMLISGRVQVVAISEEGKESGLNFFEPGDYFGEISLIDGGPRSASIVAIMQSEVAFLPKAKARWLFFNHPVVSERLLNRLCASVRTASQLRSVLSLSSADARVYSILLGMLKCAADEVATIENLPNQSALAIMANVSRETVSRAIHRLLTMGVLEKDARRLIVRDEEKLRHLALHDRGAASLRPKTAPFAGAINRGRPVGHLPGKAP